MVSLPSSAAPVSGPLPPAPRNSRVGRGPAALSLEQTFKGATEYVRSA